ncbi:sugar transferase [Phocaeicola sp.]
MYKKYIKRMFDFVISVSLLIILSPVFLLIMTLLAISNKGKVFFLQLRPGKDEKNIHVIKFKTMNEKCDMDGKLLPDKERLTCIGRFIRSTSLDELPQLLNVVYGTMSLIGPRPLLLKYLPYYTSQERIRHSVSPGITGWAQINGRNMVDWDARLAMDVWYIEHLSFTLDLKILFLTIFKVLKRSNLKIDAGTLSFQDLDEERNFRK